MPQTPLPSVLQSRAHNFPFGPTVVALDKTELSMKLRVEKSMVIPLYLKNSASAAAPLPRITSWPTVRCWAPHTKPWGPGHNHVLQRQAFGFPASSWLCSSPLPRMKPSRNMLQPDSSDTEPALYCSSPIAATSSSTSEDSYPCSCIFPTLRFFSLSLAISLFNCLHLSG